MGTGVNFIALEGGLMELARMYPDIDDALFFQEYIMKLNITIRAMAFILAAAGLLAAFPAMSADQAQDRDQDRVDTEMERDRDRDRTQDRDMDRDQDRLQDGDGAKEQNQQRNQERNQKSAE